MPVTYVYEEKRNVSFSENFVYALIGYCNTFMIFYFILTEEKSYICKFMKQF